jgi:hypothetical protein
MYRGDLDVLKKIKTVYCPMIKKEFIDMKRENEK